MTSTFQPPICRQIADAGRGMSSGMSAGTQSAPIATGYRIDLHRLRAVFPDRWSAFVRAHFADQVHVAYFFGVDAKTARNWWDGTTAPSAAFVLAAVIQFPGVAERLWKDAA